MLPDPQYRNVLVTGATSGLGRGLAGWFARRGATVWATGRRTDRLEGLRDVLAPARIVPVAMDVTDTAKTIAEVRRIDGECGGLDLVIANAGIGADTRATQADWESVDAILRTNVMGAAATLYAALPGMVERNRGHLVGISSMAAFRGLPRHSAYCASKAFLAIFLESLRVDLAGTGVRVTTIHPGFVKSELTEKNRHYMPWLLETEDATERMGRAILEGRRVYRYPLPMSLLMRAVSLVPPWLYDAVLSSLVRRAGD